jgi:hypothetical protein
MTEDAERAVQKAEAASRLATSLSEHPGFQAALARLEAQYLGHFRNSAVPEHGARDAAYFMIKALDALRQDLATTMAGGAITARNLKNHR